MITGILAKVQLAYWAFHLKGRYPFYKEQYRWLMSQSSSISSNDVNWLKMQWQKDELDE